MWFGWINDVPASRESAASWGAFGDFFGGILNPLVAGCALFWLTRSIEIQKEELADTKSELAQMKIAQQDQAKTLERQRFENTFFSLLEQHNNALARLNVPNPIHTGQLTDVIYIHNKIFKADLVLECKVGLEGENDKCGDYFRVLYHLLKFIAIRCPETNLIRPFFGVQILASVASDDEKFYSNIVRSFLGNHITQILAINCCCDESSSYWNYKCLLERYAFLEYMPFEIGGRSSSVLDYARGMYDRRVFGESDFLES
jgi:hypothetical protein